jgi:hypothetical protein
MSIGLRKWQELLAAIFIVLRQLGFSGFNCLGKMLWDVLEM